MAAKDGQCTDAENARALYKSRVVEDDVRSKSLGSAQSIARKRANQNTVAGSGGKNPGANVQAGK